jgi:RNA polymerase sigma factor (sigma-70 family)
MKSKLFEKIADDYSIMILNWAIKKTGNRADGEDLAQEVLYQILTFVKNKEDKENSENSPNNEEIEIEKLDNLIWKIAHYTWCNRIRGLKRDNRLTSLDAPAGLYIIEEHDYISEFEDREVLKEELANLRRKISDLSKVQREIIIAYYLENSSVSDIAAKFSINKSAVKWHLFDARKKLKEKMEERFNMDNNSAIYKPGRLHLGSTGERGPDPDIKRVNDSLTRQNICLLCYDDKGKSINELAEMTGIPKPYLEFDLDWLVDREFLVFDNKKYITNFGIKNRQHFENIKEIYIDSKEKYYRKIIDYFHSNERAVRDIGFYGCEFDWNKLLWSVLTLYLRYFSESEPLKTLKAANQFKGEYDLRKDGGRYIVNGFDQSENRGVDFSKQVISEPIFEPEKWHRVNGIWCSNLSDSMSTYIDGDKPEDNYLAYWLGIYIFADIPPVVSRDENANEEKNWKKILANLLNNDFSILNMTSEEKEMLAAGVKENIIKKDKKDGNKYLPQFTVFTFEQFKKLHFEIFAPLVNLVKPQTLKLVETFQALNTRSVIKSVIENNQYYIKRWTYLDIWDSGIKNFMFAAEDGYLYMPESPEDGTSLTLSFVY